MKNEMIEVLGHISALCSYTGPGKTWATEMNFVLNHAPSAGSITHPAYQQSSALPQCHQWCTYRKSVIRNTKSIIGYSACILQNHKVSSTYISIFSAKILVS